MRRTQKTIDQFISDASLPAVGPDDPVTAAMEAMKAHASDCAVVLDRDTLVGIFTERGETGPRRGR
jgi:CBS domain-containing protein